MTDPVPVTPTSPYTNVTVPVGSPFDTLHPPSTSPKITALWLRFDYDMFINMGGPVLPDLSDDRYGPALTNLFGGYAGTYYSYEGEYDWINATTPSGVTPGAFPANLHDQWRRNGMRFFTEVSHEGALSRDLPPSQPRSVSLPDQGMIKVTAPLDREVPVNVTYSGDWRIGATRYPTLDPPATPLIRRDFFHVTATMLYRSVFAPSGDTSDWNSSTHSALWQSRRPDFRSLIWYGSRTIAAGGGSLGDVGAAAVEPVNINVWDTVQPGETVHYWMARWISSNKFFMPTTSSGSSWAPLNGTADAWANPGWSPAFNWQFDSTIASGSATPNTASWTYPSFMGQGLTVNRYNVDTYPQDLPLYSTRSHCFQVVTF